jgi:hypothetical protein
LAPRPLRIMTMNSLSLFFFLQLNCSG